MCSAYGGTQYNSIRDWYPPYSSAGEMYKNGQGVAEDMNEAVACFMKGAELGVSISLLAIATRCIFSACVSSLSNARKAAFIKLC